MPAKQQQAPSQQVARRLRSAQLRSPRSRARAVAPSSSPGAPSRSPQKVKRCTVLSAFQDPFLSARIPRSRVRRRRSPSEVGIGAAARRRRQMTAKATKRLLTLAFATVAAVAVFAGAANGRSQTVGFLAGPSRVVQ